MYIHKSIIIAIAAIAIMGAISIQFLRIKSRTLKKKLIISLVALFVLIGIFDFCFNLVAEKIYTSEIVISAKSTALKTIRGGYYLVLNNDNYKYLCTNTTDARTININNCEKTFDEKAIPQIVEKEVIKTYRKEWIWFYSNSIEDVVVYEFIIPSEECILDVDKLERASAEP